MNTICSDCFDGHSEKVFEIMIIPAAFAPAGGLMTCSTLEDPSINVSEVEKKIMFGITDTGGLKVNSLNYCDGNTYNLPIPRPDP